MRTKHGGLAAHLDPEEISSAIDCAIAKIQAQLANDDFKPSLADLIRLIQLRNELSGDIPTDITARWVD